MRRGARVVVVAPYEGPLRDATAGRAAVLEPRLWVPDDFGLARYLAAGLAVLHVVDPGLRTDLGRAGRRTRRRGAAQQRGRELFTNPAKTLADRMSGRAVVLTGDNAATLALARQRRDHAADRPPGGGRRRPGRCASWRLRTGLGAQSDADREAALFHDEEIDGPLPERAADRRADHCEAERAVVAARVAGLDDVDVVGAEDVPDVGRRSRYSRAVRSSNWRCWPSGWRWRPFTCDWFEDRRVNLLRGALRTYAWGSRTAIAEFTGRPSPTAHPEAELWFGAHPGDPAWLETDGGERVAAGRRARRSRRDSWARRRRKRFGDALPFLVKVLAADEPLSLQAHPSAEQAAEGFAREERLGIPVSSPIRNYRDRSHKPELLVALDTLRGAGGIPAGAARGVVAGAGGVRPRSVRQPAGRPARRRRAARAVHHLDHRAAAAISTCWCPQCSTRAIHYVRSGDQAIRRGGQDGAGTR